ncbi:MAG: ATP-binding cassette domain-containing protein, partial [Phycisphaeraceae bacterium]
MTRQRTTTPDTATPAQPAGAAKPDASTADEPAAVMPLAIHDLTVAYHRKPVLWDIDLDIPEGKLVGIVGPNGAGKSTLIKACLGLVPVASGKVRVYGEP